VAWTSGKSHNHPHIGVSGIGPAIVSDYVWTLVSYNRLPGCPATHEWFFLSQFAINGNADVFQPTSWSVNTVASLSILNNHSNYGNTRQNKNCLKL
jgi:hypothetical protein